MKWIVVWIAIATAAGMGYEVIRLPEKPFLGMSERATQVAVVVPGGPAARAGLRTGDRIVRIAGSPIEALPDPSRFLRDRGADQTTRLIVDRSGRLLYADLVPERVSASEIAWGLALALTAAITLLIGTLAFAKKTGKLTAVFFGICFSLSILLFNPYSPPEHWGYLFSRSVITFLSALLPGLLVHFFLLFPYERSALRRFPSLALLLYLPGLLFFPLMEGSSLGVRWSTLSSESVSEIADIASSLYWVLSLLLSLAFYLHAYRASPLPTVRHKLNVTLGGAVVGLVPILVVSALHLIWPSREFPGDRLAIVTLVFLPASFGYAILRHGILDLELLVNRSLIYAGMTSAFVVAYFLAFFLLRSFIGETHGLGAQVGTVVTLLFLATLVSPVRARIQDRLNRWIYPDRYEIRRPLRETAVRLREAHGLEEVESTLLDIIRRILRVDRAALFRPIADGCFMLSRAVGMPELPPTSNERLRLGRHLTEPLFRVDEPMLRGDLEAELAHGFLPPADLETLRRIRARVLMPIQSKAGRLGVIALGVRSFQEPYSAPVLELLEGLQAQAAMAIENALFLEESRGHQDLKDEIGVARSLQQQLLPQTMPQLPELELAAINLPCHEVGGDYYDCQHLTNGDGGRGEIVLAIGDVCGKGVPAALLMANVQATFRAEAHAGRAPGELLDVLNRRLCAIEQPDRFVSFFCARYDIESGILDYANGGHLQPILVHPGGDSDRLDRGGLLLGIQEGIRYDGGGVPMHPGDLLVLYTDGVVERGGPYGAFDEDRLVDFTARNRHLSARDLLGRIIEELEQATEGEDPDDTTLLVLKVL